MARVTVNLSETDFSRALVQGFRSPATVERQDFMRESDKVQDIVFVEEASDPTGDASVPFNYVDPDGWDISVGAGIIGLKPTGGTFTLSDPNSVGPQTTGAIQWNASAADVQAAVRAALTSNWALCTVSGNAGGPYTITNAGNGLQTKLTATATALQPSGSTVDITSAQDGTATLPQAFFVELERALPIGRSSGWDELPEALPAVPVDTAGDATHNKVFKLTWNADAYGGDVQVSFTGDTTTTTLAPIPFDATELEVKAILEAHVDIEVDGVAVRKIRTGLYYLTCQGAGIALSNTPAMAIISNTLQVPPGVRGVLHANTAGCTALLDGATEKDISFEIRIDKNDGNGPHVVARVSGTLFANLIRGTNGVATAIDPTPTLSQVARYYANISAYTGGVEAEGLDGLLTVNMPVGRIVCWVLAATTTLKFYRLDASTDAQASPGKIRPDDFDAVTNAKVWVEIL